MARKPLAATDRRRNAALKAKPGVQTDEDDSPGGAGKPLANLFHDRRKTLGHGKRAG